MTNTTARSSFPEFNQIMFESAQDAVEQMRQDLKQFKYGDTLESEDWKAQLPAPLNNVSNYPALRSVLRYANTARFWKVVSAMYGINFYVTNTFQRIDEQTVLRIKNIDPDYIDNINPNFMPGYNIYYGGVNPALIDNENPSVINNLKPQTVKNITTAESSRNRYYYIYILYPGAVDSYTNVEIGKIRTDIRELVDYFIPMGREMSAMINLFADSVGT